jgi:hypothetical protein
MQEIVDLYQSEDTIKKLERDKLPYISWKRKLNQLNTFWNLASSNLSEVKVNYKYLIIKKFFTLRAKKNEEVKDCIFYNRKENEKNLANICFNSRNSMIQANGLLNETDTIKKVLEIIVAICLLYSTITVPFRLMMGIDSKTMKLIEKFVDTYFYVNIIITLRTSYKTKFNLNIYDIYHISFKYLSTYFFVDFISSVPWYYLFISSKMKTPIRIFTHAIKFFKVVKLLPLWNKLEETKYANYFRLLKIF